MNPLGVSLSIGVALAYGYCLGKNAEKTLQVTGDLLNAWEKAAKIQQQLREKQAAS